MTARLVLSSRLSSTLSSIIDSESCGFCCRARHMQGGVVLWVETGEAASVRQSKRNPSLLRETVLVTLQVNSLVYL